MALLSDNDHSLWGSLEPCPGIPAVTSAGLDTAGGWGRPPMSHGGFGIAHPTQHISSHGTCSTVLHEQALKCVQAVWELAGSFSPFVLLSFLVPDYLSQIPHI